MSSSDAQASPERCRCDAYEVPNRSGALFPGDGKVHTWLLCQPIAGRVFSHDLCDHAYGYCGQAEVAGRVSSWRTVYKYRLDYPVQTIDLPRGAFVVAVATQDGRPCIWAEVDASLPAEQRTFIGHGTGHPIPPGEVYVGTAHDVEGEGLVFHIYERTGDV